MLREPAATVDAWIGSSGAVLRARVPAEGIPLARWGGVRYYGCRAAAESASAGSLTAVPAPACPSRLSLPGASCSWHVGQSSH
jgi:hypothetical protein